MEKIFFPKTVMLFYKILKEIRITSAQKLYHKL